MQCMCREQKKEDSSLGHCCPEKYLRVIIFVEDEELGDVMDERSNEVGEYLVKAQEKNFDQECQQMDLRIFSAGRMTQPHAMKL